MSFSPIFRYSSFPYRQINSLIVPQMKKKLQKYQDQKIWKTGSYNYILPYIFLLCNDLTSLSTLAKNILMSP